MEIIPTKEDEKNIPKSSWNKDKKTKYLLNSKARNFLMCSLAETEYEKVHNFKSSKEMWDTSSSLLGDVVGPQNRPAQVSTRSQQGQVQYGLGRDLSNSSRLSVDRRNNVGLTLFQTWKAVDRGFGVQI
ncbi:hypothetical protein CR513_54889, partial [Mucuna pruriens]